MEKASHGTNWEDTYQSNPNYSSFKVNVDWLRKYGLIPFEGVIDTVYALTGQILTMGGLKRYLRFLEKQYRN